MVFEIWDTYLRPGSGFVGGWLYWWPHLERALDALLVQEQTYMEWSFTLKCLLSFNTEILLSLDFLTNFSWIVSDDMTGSPCLQVQTSDRNSRVRFLQNCFVWNLGEIVVCVLLYTSTVESWSIQMGAMQMYWHWWWWWWSDTSWHVKGYNDQTHVLSSLHFLLLDLIQCLPSMFKLECSWCKFNN